MEFQKLCRVGMRYFFFLGLETGRISLHADGPSFQIRIVIFSLFVVSLTGMRASGGTLPAGYKIAV